VSDNNDAFDDNDNPSVAEAVIVASIVSASVSVFVDVDVVGKGSNPKGSLPVDSEMIFVIKLGAYAKAETPNDDCVFVFMVMRPPPDKNSRSVTNDIFNR